VTGDPKPHRDAPSAAGSAQVDEAIIKKREESKVRA